DGVRPRLQGGVVPLPIGRIKLVDRDGEIARAYRRKLLGHGRIPLLLRASASAAKRLILSAAVSAPSGLAAFAVLVALPSRVFRAVSIRYWYGRATGSPVIFASVME